MPGFTRQAIKLSFIKLLNEQPLSKISVRDIVEECGINRNSFYYHYRDIPALIEEIISDETNAIIQQHASIASVNECFEAAFSFVLRNKKAVLHIYHSVKREMFEDYLMKTCEYTAAAYFDTVFGKDAVSEQDRATLVRFAKCGLFGICVDWMNRGLPDGAIESIQHLLSLCHGMADEVIRRCRERDREEGRSELSRGEKQLIGK